MERQMQQGEEKAPQSGSRSSHLPDCSQSQPLIFLSALIISATACTDMEDKVTDFSGKWKMKSSEHFEDLLRALGVNVFLRKIAVAAASSPAVEISQQGESLTIQTSTSVRTTNVSFTVGQSFNETTVDGRPCTSVPKWETDRKISCEQTLQKGDGPKTSWTRELTNDGELILTMSAGDVVCTRVYERE
ncbi:cellular retinoic acid-binding protein 2-like [Solea senegalensis]|uniref:Cellular retinoic acid-binding protein 1 n=2 Tax=Solea senegalensis TaxID=28829 RepID=A0AAV6R7A5_SOLSE|nr:cellular retinoic acid-binding protein 2-like [Solea senegalensis]